MTSNRTYIKVATIATAFILIAAFFQWWTYTASHPPGKWLRFSIGMLFPHEVLMPVRFMILPPTEPNDFCKLPLLSVLFALFAFFAIYRYRRYSQRLPLKIACGILIVSILESFPRMIKNYYYFINTYSPPRTSTLIFLIADFLILGLYVAGAAWLMIRLSRNK
jgi:hypothetical protein